MDGGKMKGMDRISDQKYLENFVIYRRLESPYS